MATGHGGERGWTPAWTLPRTHVPSLGPWPLHKGGPWTSRGSLKVLFGLRILGLKKKNLEEQTPAIYSSKSLVEGRGLQRANFPGQILFIVFGYYATKIY